MELERPLVHDLRTGWQVGLVVVCGGGGGSQAKGCLAPRAWQSSSICPIARLPPHAPPSLLLLLQVALYPFQADVQHSGWEGFTLHLQHAPFRAHFVVDGYNGIYYSGCANCWARDVSGAGLGGTVGQSRGGGAVQFKCAAGAATCPPLTPLTPLTLPPLLLLLLLQIKILNADMAGEAFGADFVTFAGIQLDVTAPR